MPQRPTKGCIGGNARRSSIEPAPRARGQDRLSERGSGRAREPSSPCHRAAVLDTDSGFLVVLERRLQAAGWQAEVLTQKPSAKRLSALGVEALIVDPVLLGDTPTRWLAALCHDRPELAVLVCTGTSAVADRVRHCAPAWMTG